MKAESHRIVPRLGVVLLSLLLSACSAMRETTQDLDHVFGPDYVAQVKVSGAVHPKRILLLPFGGSVTVEQKEEFERQFVSKLGESVTVVPWSYGMGMNRLVMPSEGEVQGRARELGCDAILHVEASDHRPYPPVRVVVRTILEAPDGSVLARTFGDYDAQDKSVANSARRYDQRKLQKTLDADRSMSILRSDRLFLRFAADHMAGTVLQLITSSLTVPSS